MRAATAIPTTIRAVGFDTILDDPNFAGGDFSYWQRQPIKLLGVNLKQANSLVPDLRAAKAEGQANFVNPGLDLVNSGMDFEVTPKLRLVSNANLLWFDRTARARTIRLPGADPPLHRHRSEFGHGISAAIEQQLHHPGRLRQPVAGPGISRSVRSVRRAPRRLGGNIRGYRH